MEEIVNFQKPLALEVIKWSIAVNAGYDGIFLPGAWSLVKHICQRQTGDRISSVCLLWFSQHHSEPFVPGSWPAVRVDALKFPSEIAKARVSSTKAIKGTANNLSRRLLSRALVHAAHLLFPLLSCGFVFGSVEGRWNCSFSGLKEGWHTKKCLLNYPNIPCSTVMLSNSP